MPTVSEVRPRVVVVTFECTTPPRAGGELRTQRLLAGLAQRAVVRVLTVDSADAVALRRLTGAAEVDVHPRSVSAGRARLRALLRQWPVATARWWHAEVAREIRREAAAGALVVIDHAYLDVYRPPQGRYVLSLHNVDSALVRSLPTPTSLRERLERWWDVRCLRRFERAAVARHRAEIVVVSPGDAHLLGRPGAPVVENGADVPAAVPPRPAQGTVLFVGVMTWAPNRDAVRWWLDEVAPRLPSSIPRLTVVGRGTRQTWEGTPGLDVLGEVDDLQAVLRKARVVVIPLQHGGGTRLKVLEAMAWQRPVVSTSKGAEGLRVLHGEQLLLADDPEEFARCVELLWRDDVLADSLTAAARVVAQTYDWRDIGARFASVSLGGPGD